MTNEQQTQETPTEAKTEQAQGTTPETVDTPDESKHESVMIPKARLDAEIAKRRELETAAAELATLKQAQADAEAERAGNLEKFKNERDQFAEKAERWEAYAKSRLDDLSESLDDTGKAVLAGLEGVDLSMRLATAERLAAAVADKKPSGFGSNGGKASAEAGGVIPSDVTTLSEYHSWLGNLSTDTEGRAMLADPKKYAAITAEARRRFRG